MQEISLELIETLKKEISDDQLLAFYEGTRGGWYNENTGPLKLRDSVDRVISEHDTRSIYTFSEAYSMYDLSL